MINFETINDKTVITCRTQSTRVISASDYVGNRGMNVVTIKNYTDYSNLDLAVQPINSTPEWIDSANYESSYAPITVWMTGYFAPLISSEYQFSLNVLGKLYLSNDSSSANKVFKTRFLF